MLHFIQRKRRKSILCRAVGSRKNMGKIFRAAVRLLVRGQCLNDALHGGVVKKGTQRKNGLISRRHVGNQTTRLQGLAAEDKEI